MADARAYGVGYIRIRRELVADPLPTERFIVDAPESETVEVKGRPRGDRDG
jgi:hypothetical protein